MTNEILFDDLLENESLGLSPKLRSAIRENKATFIISPDTFAFNILSELVSELLSDDRDQDYFFRIATLIKEATEFGSTSRIYACMWLGDFYYYFREYEKALAVWRENLRADSIQSTMASNIISLKLYLDKPLEAIDLLTFKKKLTKHGRENLDLMIQYMDKIIQTDYADKTISSSYFLESGDQKHISASLFSGCYYGYYINNAYMKKPDALMPYNIFKLPYLEEYALNVSRRAENVIREDLGLPKVGEGWISETDLYYKLKKYFPQYTIIQHYSDKWLGKQHLDVYIQELNLGVEYHGKQHFEPVDFFGGEQAYLENVKRDKRKINKCRRNSTKLIVVSEGYDFNKLAMDISNYAKTLKDS